MAEEKQSLLPIYCRNDNKMVKNAAVLEVKKNLNEVLESVVVDEHGLSEKGIQPSIYKVPKFMKEIQEKAFEPQLLSLGPYHHENPNLVPMEQEKKKAFRRFVKDNGVEYESIVENVSNILENLWGAYDQLDGKWKEDDGAKFMEVMIVDGCFVLDILKECPSSLYNLRSNIKRDMLLLENQLPLKLLQVLYVMIPNTNQQGSSQTLSSLICRSSILLIGDENAVIGKDLHILEMYIASLLYPRINRDNRSREKKKKKDNKDHKFNLDRQIIPQATLLREAGITFKQSPTKSLTDVRFVLKTGVLELPCLVVDDNTEATFLNMMAFEKLHKEAGSKVTSFIVLMDNLIDIDTDVALLSSKKIIANALGNDVSAADLFGLLGNGAAMDLDSYITDVLYLVNEHCSQSWNEWVASLKHNYFNNPWTIISFVAAIFGFAILIVQAVYQIVDYHTK